MIGVLKSRIQSICMSIEFVKKFFLLFDDRFFVGIILNRLLFQKNIVFDFVLSLKLQFVIIIGICCF